jgi:competence protein ComFB
MELKNYQEDVVFRAIDIVREERPDLPWDDVLINDTAAYVLNRIPPRYITSDRGFNRLAAEHIVEEENKDSLVNAINLMVLVNQALDVITSRRSSPRHNGRTDISEPRPMELGLIHNFPQIVGKVLDAGGTPIDGARVTLLLDGRKVPPAEPGWSNPSYTNDRTQGLYSFWPASARDQREEVLWDIQIVVEHDRYKPVTIDTEVETVGTFEVNRVIQSESILYLDPVRLEPKATVTG